MPINGHSQNMLNTVSNGVVNVCVNNGTNGPINNNSNSNGSNNGKLKFFFPWRNETKKQWIQTKFINKKISSFSFRTKTTTTTTKKQVQPGMAIIDQIIHIKHITI